MILRGGIDSDWMSGEVGILSLIHAVGMDSGKMLSLSVGLYFLSDHTVLHVRLGLVMCVLSRL